MDKADLEALVRVLVADVQRLALKWKVDRDSMGRCSVHVLDPFSEHVRLSFEVFNSTSTKMSMLVVNQYNTTGIGTWMQKQCIVSEKFSLHTANLRDGWKVGSTTIPPLPPEMIALLLDVVASHGWDA